MVEFGLKLEDNKVSEWSEHYLNYEKLKATLKKAKSLQKKIDEQSKKQPMDAVRILEYHRAGNTKYVTSSTPNQSGTNLAGAQSQTNLQSLEETQEEQAPTEMTSLLSSSPPRPPLSSAPPSPSIAGSPGTISATGEKVVKKMPSSLVSRFSDISDYFGSRYERTLRGYLKDMDGREKEFEELLLKEQTKVVTFYYKKLGELESRLQLLIESVANSSIMRIRKAKLDMIDEEQSGLIGSLRLGKPKRRIEELIATFSQNIHKQEQKFLSQRRIEEEVSMENVPVIKDDSDDEGETQGAAAVAEADSIQRALIDQYRTAKLLHNFAILNYTGFVKIVKKHDKSLPHRKGRFKGILTAHNLFHEGQAVDDLATRYETCYANWFCDGDLRAAHAQMLPKRGDGLEMDWSQLRLGYRMGMCAVLALWVCWDCIWGLVSEGYSTIGGRDAFPVFRACGGILLLQWFWGCSVFIWTRYRVNYIYLFDFNPRIVATPLGIFEEAVDHTLVFLTLMLLYYKVSEAGSWLYRFLFCVTRGNLRLFLIVDTIL
jgi:hypothetical protein